MVQIIIQQDCIEIKGHANFSKKNQDIVCAGISAVVLGACELWKNDKTIQIFNNVNQGWVKIIFDSKAQKNQIIQNQITLIKMQLKMIAINYSLNVKILNLN